MSVLTLGMFVQFVGGEFANHVRLLQLKVCASSNTDYLVTDVLVSAAAKKVKIFDELARFSSHYADFDREKRASHLFMFRTLTLISTLVEMQIFPIQGADDPEVVKWVAVDPIHILRKSSKRPVTTGFGSRSWTTTTKNTGSLGCRNTF